MATIKNDRLIAIGIFDFVIEALKKEGFDNFLFFASKTDGCSIEKIVSSRFGVKPIIGKREWKRIMTTKRLKCSFQVMAGLIPEIPLPEYERNWHLSADEVESGCKFMDTQASAILYAGSIMDHTRVNWVSLNWIWY